MSVLAPCLHSRGCPLLAAGKEACSFTQRVQKPPLMNELWPDSKGYRDVEYVYLLATHCPDEYADKWVGRIVREPMRRGGHVINDVCSPTGSLQRHINTKHQGTGIYKAARQSRKGDLWSHPGKSIITK